MNYIERQHEIIDGLRISRKCGPDLSTIPIQSSHSATARTLTMVAFLPEPLARTIEAALIAPLRAVDDGHHYYPADALHLTVKNVRVMADPPNFDDSTVETAVRVLEDVAPRHRSVTFRLDRLIATDTSVALFGTAGEDFRDLVLDLDDTLRRNGIPDNKRYISTDVFFGNVTICRFAARPTGSFLEAITELERCCDLPFAIERIDLTCFDSLCRAASRGMLGSSHLEGRDD